MDFPPPTNITSPLHLEQSQPTCLRPETQTSVIEADPTTLGLSQNEQYSTTNERAERLAQALERLGKCIEDFPETRERTDEIAPREALIPLLIESMRNYRNDCKVADRALSTLRKLTISKICRSHIGECNGIQAVILIMRCHSLLIRIQTQGCLTLANLTYENELNKQTVIRHGGLQAVIAALSQHKNEENVQSWGCLAIRNFTNYSYSKSSNTQDISSLASEAISVLLCAIEQYPNAFIIQQNAFIALINIATCSNYGLQRIRDEGGIHTLIDAMKINIHSEKLSEIMLCLSRVLVEDKKVQKLFGQNGGIQTITSIMDFHNSHIGIAVKGCATFRNLAFQRENRHLFGQFGSIRTIVNVLLLPFQFRHAVDPDALSYFFKALSNATYDSLSNKGLAGRLGAIDVTLKLMSDSKYNHEERVIVDACRALRNLVDGVTQNHKLFIKAKGISVILNALKLHGVYTTGIAEHGIAIFVNMSSSRSFANHVLDPNSDVVEMAQQIQNAYVSNELVRKQASSLLGFAMSSHRNTDINTANQMSKSIRLSQQRIQGQQSSCNSSTPQHPVRALKSHHHSEEEQQGRVHRLRSLPLALSRFRS